MIRSRFLTCTLLCLAVETRSQEQDRWSTPELRLLHEIAVASMADYTEWSAGFRQAGLPPSDADWTVNSMTEQILIRLLKPLQDHSNPDLLRECLRFLGEEVPETFDYGWRLVLLEMSSNIDFKVGDAYDAELAKSGRMGLKQRAMRKDAPGP